MKREDRDRRDLLVAARRMQGATIPVLMREFDLSHGAIYDALRRARNRKGLEDAEQALQTSPMVLLGEVIGTHRGVLEKLSIIAENGENDSVRVGALKGMSNAASKLFETMQAVGAVPQSARDWVALAQLQDFVAAMRDRWEAAGLDWDELAAEIERWQPVLPALATVTTSTAEER